MSLGARPLSEDEISRVQECFTRTRDKTLFMLACRTGFRISEALSLTVADVFQHEQVVDVVYLKRCNSKGKVEGRAVPLHNAVRCLISDLIREEGLGCSDPLFRSKKGGSLGRIQAHRLFVDAFAAARITGKVSTHSCRKSFSQKVYMRSGKDLIATQKALGHKSIANTARYLSFCDSELTNIILGD